jgi:hypothetical protein
MATNIKVINKKFRYGMGIAMAFLAVFAGMETFVERDPWDAFACIVFMSGAAVDFWLAEKY